MGIQVVLGAICMCDMGDAPTPLVVELPLVLADALPAANIVDGVPFLNVEPFGICDILTAEALGVPIPCVPATVVWAPGVVNVLIEGIPALDDLSILQCALGGTIVVVEPGQATVIDAL
jgi:hypothetical protein